MDNMDGHAYLFERFLEIMKIMG